MNNYVITAPSWRVMGTSPQSGEDEAAIDKVIRPIIENNDEVPFKIAYSAWEHSMERGIESLLDIITQAIIDRDCNTRASGSSVKQKTSRPEMKETVVLARYEGKYGANVKNVTEDGYPVAAVDDESEYPERGAQLKEMSISHCPPVECNPWDHIYLAQDLNTGVTQKPTGKCIEWRERGVCSRQPNCRFHHVPAIEGTCKDEDYLKYGFCSNHFECPYRHHYDRETFGPRQPALEKYLFERKNRGLSSAGTNLGQRST